MTILLPLLQDSHNTYTDNLQVELWIDDERATFKLVMEDREFTVSSDDLRRAVRTLTPKPDDR